MKGEFLLLCVLLPTMVLLAGCITSNDEVNLLKSFDPGKQWKVEELKEFKSDYLVNQKPILALSYYSSSPCLRFMKGGTGTVQFNPEVQVALVEKWSKETFFKFEEWIAKLNKAETEQLNCNTDCYEECKKDENVECMSVQQISRDMLPSCCSKCSTNCGKKFRVVDTFDWVPSIKKGATPAIINKIMSLKNWIAPAYSTKDYSIYFMVNEKNEKEIFAEDYNANCYEGIWLIDDIEEYLCKSGNLYYADSNGSRIDDCSFFEERKKQRDTTALIGLG